MASNTADKLEISVAKSVLTTMLSGSAKQQARQD
jgi:hypothetical protein